MMDKNEINQAIRKFMYPTVFTGVKPLFLVAEELATKKHTGDIIDAVWVRRNADSDDEFTYITKFAVKGQIINRNYYSKEEMEPFSNRLALPNENNLEKMILHRRIKEEIEDVKAKRDALENSIEKDFESLLQILKRGEEVFLFKKGYGEWYDPFNTIDIDAPYKILKIEDSELSGQEYHLQSPKNGTLKVYSEKNEFYAYIVGGKADIDGLRLKNESYKKEIETMQDEARYILSSIEWLSFNDSRIKSIIEKLPKHPFDNYFNYVKKGDERKLQASWDLIKALELIIAKHMPKQITPMGIQYIPIDNLLYLFHEVIPRADALLALESCDIIHEPAALLLGYEGKREFPPKFLVPVTHIVSAYKKFPSFVEACERYLSESRTSKT
ncbi:hypothetical protein [Sulfurimonas sp.]|jgi:hypothetical protein|uniref:hypothetical protein n=1 Tax=Sulfurimonas sp. TaxID=2022749 RepID=UPI0025E08E4C|nr:hypothetical protein [Sulfurimonas sp.]MBT5935964.1 hypothetical protein [Sulfurimonas sp.]